MKKRFLCLSLIFALAAAQVMPVAAARKDEVQAEKANTQSKLSATESKEAELEEKKNNLLGEIDSLDRSFFFSSASYSVPQYSPVCQWNGNTIWNYSGPGKQSS